MKKVKVDSLKVDDIFVIRPLNEDAIQRYMELYQSGNEKAIIAQAKTQRVIDGFHRLAAAKRLKLDKVSVEFVDVEDHDIRALAYKYNKAHGVPISREERDKLIIDLRMKDGKTQTQIADIVGLSRQAISKIISNATSSNADKGVDKVDKRRKLTDEDRIAISRLLLGGEGQKEVAKEFRVSQSQISEVWSEIRDEVHKLYTEEKLLKREVSEKVGLALEEVDKILQQYGDPLNFEPMVTTWWPAFGLDNRFGRKHASNLPADLVKNIFALYTNPGNIILDPAAGGGVTIDVANDMVNRKCFAYDIAPKRDDIRTHNLVVEKPTEPEKPNLIFLDLPYGPAKKGEYTPAHPSDLANKSPAEFLEDLEKIFGYWDSGNLVVLMSSFREKGTLIDLPFETEKRMVDAGWKIVEHIVNEHGRIKSETGYWVSKAKKDRWLLRKHIHILVGKK